MDLFAKTLVIIILELMPKARLKDFFNTHNLFAISDIDTRALVGYIRDNGAMNAVISTDVNDIRES